MRRFLKTFGNAALVVGGFFTVFFGVSRSNDYTSDSGVLGGLDTDIAFADAPPSSGDSYGGCGGGGGDGGDCGDSGK